MLNRVFGNRYRLVEKIGIGGMAEVYKATDEVLGRTVAVKVMLPQYSNDPTFAARFKQEAQSAANLQSPFIVNIYDWGYESTDNIYYIAMEYVRGTDLKTAIQQRGTINQRKAAEIASQVCAALSVAHGYDIIHRDIKPHNIMVQPDGNAKVMDFGIARAQGSSMTQTGSVLGTAYYVSPEQAQGRPLTPATDLYSLGVVLYEITTGKVPFDAPDAVAVALKQVNERPVPPSRINPSIDPKLESIIMRAMEKNPANRYSTAEQMRIALNNYLAGRPINSGVELPSEETRIMAPSSTLPVIGPAGAASPIHTAIMPSIVGAQQPLNVRSSAKAREEKERRRRRVMMNVAIVITLLVIIAAGIAIVNYLMSGSEEKVEVPYVISMTEEEARDMILEAGLKVGSIKPEYSDQVPKGRIISSSPSARVKVNKDTEVTLVVSTGTEPLKEVEVPYLRNMTQSEAEAALEQAGLRYKRSDDRFDEEVESGKVCAQDTEPGSKVLEGTTVTFYVSKGRDTVRVQNVVGATWSAAEEVLYGLGFTVSWTENEYSDEYPDGMVMRQSPGPGEAPRGSNIILTMSLGPEPIIIPWVTGMTYADAYAEISNVSSKLIVIEMKTDATELYEIDRVMWTDPPEGTAVPPGTVVTVYVGVEVLPPGP